MSLELTDQSILHATPGWATWPYRITNVPSILSPKDRHQLPCVPSPGSTAHGSAPFTHGHSIPPSKDRAHLTPDTNTASVPLGSDSPAGVTAAAVSGVFLFGEQK